jgi:hypothetical protein
VFDLAFLLSSAIPAIAFVVSLVVVRRLAGGQPIDLAVLFGNAGHMPWPRGVQEEEPRPWRFELLDRRRTAAGPNAATRVAGTCVGERSRVGV